MSPALPGAHTSQLVLLSLFVLPGGRSVGWARACSPSGAPSTGRVWRRQGRGLRPAPRAAPLVPSRFLCDDVDFNLRVHSAGLLLCRFNRFSVMKKQIAVGGHRSLHVTSKVGGPSAWPGLPLGCGVRGEDRAGAGGEAAQPSPSRRAGSAAGQCG